MKFGLIYYKNVLDIVVQKFFNDFNDDFVKIGSYYVLGKSYTKSYLEDYFKKQVVDAILQFAKPWSIVDPEYCFVIGSCMPSDNILLDFKKDGTYFPQKLDSLLKSDIQLKYVLKENDIKIDIILFNEIFMKTFNSFFQSKDAVAKQFGKDYSNIIFIQHRSLDCYTLFKSLKFLYGKNNCTNIWKKHLEKAQNADCPLVSLNELICKYINNKYELNRSTKFRQMLEEVKQFVDSVVAISR